MPHRTVTVPPIQGLLRVWSSIFITDQVHPGHGCALCGPAGPRELAHAEKTVSKRNRNVPFSRRNRYARAAKEIMIREAAPESLRSTVLETPCDLGWLPTALRRVSRAE